MQTRKGAGDAVYVYELQAGSWTEAAVLRSPSPTGLDGNGGAFGLNLDLAGDTLVVGESELTSSSGSNPDRGAAYIFRREDDAWGTDPIQSLAASEGSASDAFGARVAIDDMTVVVGAFLDDTANGTNSGSAYVFNVTPDDGII